MTSEYYDSKGNRYTLELSRQIYQKNAACVLMVNYYEAGNTEEMPAQTTGVAIWTDWDWQHNTPFVEAAEYSRIQRFFQYDS